MMIPHLPRCNDLEETWLYVSEGVDQIMHRVEEGLSKDQYVHLYTAIYNYCTSTQTSEAITMVPSSESEYILGAHQNSSRMYRHLKDYLENYLDVLADKLKSLEGREMLNFYAVQWRRYSQSSSLLDHLFKYLNRYWISREINAHQRGIYNINVTTLICWKEKIFDIFHETITDFALKTLNMLRCSQDVDGSVIKTVCDSYVALGLDGSDYQKTTLKLYKEYFESRLIRSTEEFYRNEASSFLKKSRVEDYLLFVEKKFQDEAKTYELVHPSSQEGLRQKCDEILIERQITLLKDEFPKFLEQDDNDNLERLYKLVVRIGDVGLNPLRKHFEEYVKDIGSKAIESITVPSEETIDSKIFVETLLQTYRKFHDMVLNAFSSDAGFIASLDRACREFVNRNQFCTSSTKCPELLVRFCDSLLRKGGRKYVDSDSQMESQLDNVVSELL